jgi:hypothetical protein
MQLFILSETFLVLALKNVYEILGSLDLKYLQNIDTDYSCNTSKTGESSFLVTFGTSSTTYVASCLVVL